MIKINEINSTSLICTEEFNILCTNGDFIKTNAIGLNKKTSQFETIDLDKKTDYIIPIKNKLNCKDDPNRTYQIFLSESWKTNEDYDLGQFIGLFAGDGWWDKPQYKGKVWCNRKLHIADVPGYNYAFVENYLKNKIKVKGYDVIERFIPKEQAKWCEGDSRKFSIIFDQCDRVCDFLTKILGGERGNNHNGAGNKKLNIDFENSNYDFRKGLLAGLLSSDGSVSLNHAFKKERLIVNYSTISKQLAVDIKKLSDSLGVHTTLTFDKRPTKSGNKVYILSFSVVDLKLTQVLDGRMAYKPKYELFTKTMVETSKPKFKYVPITLEFYNDIKALLIFSNTKDFSRKSTDPLHILKVQNARVADAFFRAKDFGYMPKVYFTNVAMPFIKSAAQTRKQKYLDAVEFLNIIKENEQILDKQQYTLLQEGMKACFNNIPTIAQKPLFQKGNKLLKALYHLVYKSRPISEDLKNKLLAYFSEISPLSYNEEYINNYLKEYVNNNTINWTTIKINEHHSLNRKTT